MPASWTCRWCGRDRGVATCMNTRDMDEIGDPTCRSALMTAGGGERTVNRLEARRLATAEG